jgi:hypothetical protein
MIWIVLDSTLIFACCIFLADRVKTRLSATLRQATDVFHCFVRVRHHIGPGEHLGELSWPSRATSHRNYDGGNPSCLRTFRKYGPLPHLSARSFRPHHGRVFRRVRIGCRGDARGPHTAGTVSRGRSLEKRQLPCPSEPRGPAALGPGAERMGGVSLAGTASGAGLLHASLRVSLGRCDMAEALTHARPLNAQPKFASNTARAKPGGVMLRRSPRSSDSGRLWM